MYRYLIAFGSNLGKREQSLGKGIRHLEGFGKFVELSQRLNTKALAPESEPHRVSPDYLNQVAFYLSEWDPDRLYLEIRLIENEVGHPRTGVWPDRHLDVDLVKMWTSKGTGWISKEWKSDTVVLPHPRFAERDFLRQLLREMNQEPK